MKNMKIRETLKQNGMKQWQLAQLLGIAESTMCIRMRNELPDAEQERIIAIIRENRG